MKTANWILLFFMTIFVFVASYLVTLVLTWLYESMGTEVFCLSWATFSAFLFFGQAFFAAQEAEHPNREDHKHW